MLEYRAKDGLPAAILPLLHYALLGYSRHLARYLSINGYILHAKSDLVRKETSYLFNCSKKFHVDYNCKVGSLPRK